uniref:SB domain-containing protein n=1 Tax=Rhizophora mucronata TaxID=61149 RepID=A0A2P2QP05_RHIMU
MHQSDLLINWLRVTDGKSLSPSLTVADSDEAFEAVDENSKLVIDCLAADRAIDDLIDALDKALEQQVLNIDAYTKQVRALAREQFYSRRKLIKN